MRTWLRFLGFLVFVALLFSLFPPKPARAKEQKELSLYCTDIAESTWVTSQTGNHILTVPFKQQHFVHIVPASKKVFLDNPMQPEAPNNPALGDVTLTGISDTEIEVSNASTFTKPHADAVTRFTFTIDRRTGLFVQTDEVLRADNTVSGGSETVRLCGTGEPRF